MTDGEGPLAAPEQLLSEGLRLSEEGRDAEALDLYDSVANEAAGAIDVRLRGTVDHALYLRALTLEKLGRDDEALSAYDTAAASLESNLEPESRTRYAYALMHKAALLGKLGRREEEIRAWSELEQLDGEPDQRIHEVVAWGLKNKGMTLVKLNRFSDALEAFDAVIDRFGAASNWRIRRVTLTARLSRRTLRLLRLDRT
jgi:tetratricopeptide (TPR) repeat protein